MVSNENTFQESLECPYPDANTCLHFPVDLPQILAVPSCEAVAICDPSAENTAKDTARRCTESVCLHSPVELSQILAVQSSDTVTTCDPSAENIANLTRRPCPDSIWETLGHGHALHVEEITGHVPKTQLPQGQSAFGRSRHTKTSI